MAEPKTFLVGPERRPCYINGKRGMFHQWINRAEVAPPSMMIGGHQGGQLWDVFGLVEMEDGHMIEVVPTKVVFADGGDFMVTAFRSTGTHDGDHDEKGDGSRE